VTEKTGGAIKNGQSRMDNQEKLTTLATYISSPLAVDVLTKSLNIW